jgi:hypothetical protein
VVEFTMKRWIIPVLLAILLCSLTVTGAADDQFDPGRANLFNLPFFKIPLGSNTDSGDAREKKEKEEVKSDQTKEKEKEDKKVDDAIRKAWEER